jgi:hypothetical protein
MGINNIIKNTLKTKWTWTDDFSFFFQNTKVQFPGDMNLSPQDVWDMTVTNIDLPQVSAQVDSIVIAQKHRFWVPLHDTFTFTVNFRDVEKMKLKEYFTQIWAEQQTEYFDKVKSTVKIIAGEGVMFESSNVLISNVSQSQLDNTNTQIIEFSVEFVASDISNNTLKAFDGKIKPQEKGK